MADEFSFLTTTPLTLLGFLVILGVFAVCAGVLWYVFNKKYPKVKFDVWEGNLRTPAERRLIGRQVVNASLFDIVIMRKPLVGPSIDDFPYIYGPKGEQIFQASYVNNQLIPMKYDALANTLEIQKYSEPMSLAVQIATRFILMIEATMEQLDKLNPIVNIIMQVIPTILPILAFGIIVYLLLNYIGGTIQGVVSILEDIVVRLDSITEKVGTGAGPPPPPGATYNVTNPNIPYISGG